MCIGKYKPVVSSPAIVMALMVLLALISGCGPDKSIRYYNLGLEAVERKDYEEAIRLWNESVRFRPDDPETRYNLGLALVTMKRYREAEEQLRKAVALNSLDHQTHQLLGKCLEEQGALIEAKLSYESSLNIKPNYVPAFIGLASVALKENRNRTAEEYATRAAELDPNNLEANLLLSEALFRNDNFDAAYSQLLSARRLGANDPDLLLLLGKVTYSRHMYADAFETLGAARSAGASTDETFLYLALSALALGDTPEAEKQFRLSLYKNDKNAGAWKGLGETYLKEKKWDQASEAIAKAARLAPDDPEIALDAAVVAVNTGELEAAARALEILRVRPDAPQITNYYLGHAYLRMGRNGDARSAFERFIQTWQGNGDLVDEVQALLDRLAR